MRRSGSFVQMTIPEASQTVVVVLGVSEYAERDIEALPAAQADAVKFARAMKNWGVAESNIVLLVNQDATKQNFDSLFEGLEKIEGSFKVVFYFCGHGFRNVDVPPKSYLLLYNSSVHNGQCRDGLSLEYILSKIGRLQAIEAYLLMDACYLRINEIINPRLQDELSGGKFSRKGVFCLLSSGIQESFENETEQYGYFTEALLKALSEQNKAECSLSYLVSAINQEMKQKDLPLPEVYNIGCQTLSIPYVLDPSFLRRKTVYRHDFISHVQNVLVQNRGKVLCLVGKSGIGKTVLCQTMASKKLKTLHINIPSTFENDFNPFVYVINNIQKLSEDFSSSCDSFYGFDHRFSSYLILIDQVERLNPQQIEALIAKIVKLKMKFILFSTQYLGSFIPEKLRQLLDEIEIPPMSLEEGSSLIQMIQPEISEEEAALIHQLACGNPLNIKKIAFNRFAEASHESLKFKQELIKVVEAISACGFYINEGLFARTFQLQVDLLNFVKDVGLVQRTDNGYFPTSAFHEIAEIETLKIDRRKTIDYWYHQLDEFPDHLQAARALIVSLVCFGYEPQADPYLKTAFHLFYQTGKSCYPDLLEGANIFRGIPYLTEASLSLAELLLEMGEFNQSYALLNKTAVSLEFAQRAKFCEAQILGHTGYYKESIYSCSQLIQSSRKVSEKMRFYLYRGMSYFALGNWAEAFADFDFVYKKAQDEHYIGRAQCMIGTLMGIRGIDLPTAKSYLEEGVQLLTKLGDASGMWAGWNNLGEVLWKCGEYSSSAFYLEKALELSQTMNFVWVILETLRNLLHLHLRWKGSFSKEAGFLLSRIESLSWDSCEPFEKMQLLNALSTAYLFQGDYKKAIFLLKMVFPLTRDNGEYHIYTLSNLSLLSRGLGWWDKSERFLKKAIELARRGENYLAVHQIKNDYAICFKEVIDF